jgi:hypothetical protein
MRAPWKSIGRPLNMFDITFIKSSLKIHHLHDEFLQNPAWPSSDLIQSDQLVRLISINHFYNTSLWNEEDLARRKKVSDSEIANNKRQIDHFNQQRNNAIEDIDEFILNNFANVKLQSNASLNSETAGSMIDRMSILSLKIFHMRLQTLRSDVTEDHITQCNKKLLKLIEQRIDLGSCLEDLLNKFSIGLAYYKIYRQFKMYNDPKLNPQIYNE